jgi:hypothetical protein
VRLSIHVDREGLCCVRSYVGKAEGYQHRNKEAEDFLAKQDICLRFHSLALVYQLRGIAGLQGFSVFRIGRAGLWSFLFHIILLLYCMPLFCQVLLISRPLLL